MVMVTSCAVPSSVSTVNVSGQRLAVIERLHRRVAVVERVGPHAVRAVSAIGAVAVVVAAPAATACQASAVLSTSAALRSPVSVGVPARAVGDAAGLDDRAGAIAGDGRRVVLGVDGDRHHLRRAVRGQRGERVGQRRGAVQRLHRGIVVVERVGPDAGRGQRVGAVAVGASRRRPRPPARRRPDCRRRSRRDCRCRSACPACRWRRRPPR